MLTLRLCAWHPKYHHYPRLLGVKSWCGAWVTHGLCARCQRRFLGEKGVLPS